MQTNENEENGNQQITELEKAEREKTFSRRALLRAGWVIPTVIVMSNLPTTVQAGSAESCSLSHCRSTNDPSLK